MFVASKCVPSALQKSVGSKTCGAPEQIFANVTDVVFRIRVLRRFDHMVVGPERCSSRRLDEFRRCPNDRSSTTDDVVLKQSRPRHAQPHHPSLQPRLEAVLLLRFHVEPSRRRARVRVLTVDALGLRELLAIRYHFSGFEQYFAA